MYILWDDFVYKRFDWRGVLVNYVGVTAIL